VIKVWLKVGLVLVALCGALARWAIKAHYHFGFGGWPEVWRQEFYAFDNNKCMPCWVALYIMGWLYSCAPYIVTAAGGIFLRSSAAVAVLILLTVGLIALNVEWYFTENSRDWYLALSPFILTPIAFGCLLIAWIVDKVRSSGKLSKEPSE
jgi:hypothetical protein